MRPFFAAALFAAAAFTVACAGIADPSDNKTETFNGTIAVQGTAAGHFFTADRTGEYTVKVTSLSPSNGSFFGAVLAQSPGDGSCAGNLPIIQQSSFGTVNTPVLTGPIYRGNYCVFLFDIGAFTVPQTYTLTVSHP